MGQPLTLQINQTATLTLTEYQGLNGTGLTEPPLGPIVYSSNNNSLVSFPSPNVVKALAPGQCTLTGSDPAAQVSDSIFLTIPSPAQSAVLTAVIN